MVDVSSVPVGAGSTHKDFAQPAAGPLLGVGVEARRVNVKSSPAERLLYASAEKQKIHETMNFLKDQEK